MDRRQFLSGAGAGLAGASLVGVSLSPAEALAGPGSAPGSRPVATEADEQRLQRRVGRVRRRRQRLRRRLERAFARRDEPEALERAWIRASSAYGALEAVGRLDARDHVHHDVQSLIEELLLDIGEGVHAIRELCHEVEVQQPEVPDEELERAFARIDSLNLEDAEGSPASRRVTFHTAKALREDLREEGLVAVSTRFRRKLDRAVRVSEHLAAEPGRIEALNPGSDELKATLEEGRRFWGARAGKSSIRRPAARAALIILGIAVSAIAIVIGGVYSIGLIMCGLNCDAPALVGVGLLGLVLVGLLTVGVVYLVQSLRDTARRFRRRDRHPPPPPLGSTATPPEQLARRLCRMWGSEPTDDRILRLRTAIAVAYGRGISPGVIQEYDELFPTLDLLPLTLSHLEWDGYRWAPSVVLLRVQSLYEARGWEPRLGVIEEDLDALEAAYRRKARARDVEEALRRASAPGTLDAVLSGL